MSGSLEQVEAEALKLPLRDRAALAHRLIDSLDEDADEDPAEVERSWEEEIRRRLDELEAGKAELIPADEVFREVRAQLRP